MELKIWVDGMPRVICGVSLATTTHEVIVAVAKARRKTGRYRMVIRRAAYPEQDQILKPSERPLEVLQRFSLTSGSVRLLLTCAGNNDLQTNHQPKYRFRHRTPDKRRHSINSKFTLDTLKEDEYLQGIIGKYSEKIKLQFGNIEQIDREILEYAKSPSSSSCPANLEDPQSGEEEPQLDDDKDHDRQMASLRQRQTDTTAQLHRLQSTRLQLTQELAAVDSDTKYSAEFDEFSSLTDTQLAGELAKLREIALDVQRKEKETQQQIDEAKRTINASSSSQSSTNKDGSTKQKVLWV